jgi:hypothetical protein
MALGAGLWRVFPGMARQECETTPERCPDGRFPQGNGIHTLLSMALTSMRHSLAWSALHDLLGRIAGNFHRKRLPAALEKPGLPVPSILRNLDHPIPTRHLSIFAMSISGKPAWGRSSCHFSGKITMGIPQRPRMDRLTLPFLKPKVIRATPSLELGLIEHRLLMA